MATPQLLRAFGIKPSQVDPKADILTMRPGLSSLSEMQLVYGNYFNATSATLRPRSASVVPVPEERAAWPTR